MKAPQAIRVGHDVQREQLQSDWAIESRVVRPVHFAHSAFAELVDDSIGANLPADHGRDPRAGTEVSYRHFRGTSDS